MQKINSVDDYLGCHKKWSEELRILRSLIDSTELVETIKWGAPVYTLNSKNVLSLGAFKNHFGIWFFNGVFLKDAHHLLVNAQEGKTKAMRQFKFIAAKDINENQVLAYIKEAIENQKAGKEVKPDLNTKSLIIPELLQKALSSDAILKQSYDKLTPYKQREYAEYLNTAKRDATKIKRLEKIKPMILQGIGLHDKYRNC